MTDYATGTYYGAPVWVFKFGNEYDDRIAIFERESYEHSHDMGKYLISWGIYRNSESRWLIRYTHDGIDIWDMIISELQHGCDNCLVVNIPKDDDKSVWGLEWNDGKMILRIRDGFETVLDENGIARLRTFVNLTVTYLKRGMGNDF